jgi:hypothetical protein
MRITNHESPIRRTWLAQGGPVTFHFSPFTFHPILFPSHFSLLTSHDRASGPRSASSWTTLLSRFKTSHGQPFEREPQNVL